MLDPRTQKRPRSNRDRWESREITRNIAQGGEQGLVTGGVLKFSVAQTNDDEEEEKEEESIVAIETGDYAAPAVFRSRNADDNRANRAIIQLHGSIY